MGLVNDAILWPGGIKMGFLKNLFGSKNIPETKEMDVDLGEGQVLTMV